MIVAIHGVLCAEELAHCARIMDEAEWADGDPVGLDRTTGVAALRHLSTGTSAAAAIGQIVSAALGRAELFIAAALPARIFPPAIVSHGPGDAIVSGVDQSFRIRQADGVRVRGDLSATLFLSDPAHYDGGELLVDDTYGPHSIKLAAGDLALFAASSPSTVKAISRGERRTASFSVQSTVRDDEARAMLFELDRTVLSLADGPEATRPEIVRLTNIYHNLMRRWAEA